MPILVSFANLLILVGWELNRVGNGHTRSGLQGLVARVFKTQHIGSVHLSGVESLSDRYRMVTLTVFRRCQEGIAGRVRLLEEVSKVWENQQERRVGRSLIFESGVLWYNLLTSDRGWSWRVHRRNKVEGSTMVAGSSTMSSPSLFRSWDWSLGLIVELRLLDVSMRTSCLVEFEVGRAGWGRTKYLLTSWG